MVEKVMSRSLRMMFSSGMAIGLGILSQSTLAQQSSQPADASVQSIVITGSSIPRADAETSSPVQVLTADDLKKSGYTSIEQILENLTSNGAGALNQGFTGAFAAGGSGIALRGLTVAATLVLIDGHRMAPNAMTDDGQRSFVDISNIPFDAIERVEVLKDGASAIYGSDAMAGVVNIILKKSFVGTTVNAEGGSSTEGGGTTTHVSIMHGMGNLNEDGYNAYINLEYRRQDSVSYSQRAGDGGWTNQNWTGIGGTNQMPYGGQPYLQSLNGATTIFLPGPCNAALLASTGCTTQTGGDLIPQTQNVNVLGSFTKKLEQDWSLNVKASIFDSKDDIVPLGHGQMFPQSYSGVPSGGPNSPGGVFGAQTVTVPATYPGNTTGQPMYVYGDIPGAGNYVNGLAVSSNTESKAYRLVADLDGTIGDWDVKSSLGYTRDTINVDYTGMLNVTALNAALNRTVNPFSLTGPNSAADMAAIFPSNSQFDGSTLDFAEFHATRTLMTLPGGNLGFSAGAEFIHRNLNSPDSPAAQTGSASGSWLAWAVGSQTDTAAYAEVYAPVLKTLEIDGAVRFDHINGGIGNNTAPKIGFKWSPSEMVSVRGTLATGFRAPNPAENGNAGLVYSDAYTYDPTLCPGGSTSTPGAVTKYCNYEFAVRESSNPALQPEKSKTGTIGAILEPVKGWGTTVDLYRIEIDNQIVPGALSALPVYGPALPQTCNNATGTAQVPCGPGTGYTGLNTGTPLYYTEPYVNANTIKTSGLELSTSYRFKMGDYGNLTPKFDWSHMIHYAQTVAGIEYELAGTHGPSSVNADSGNPKDRIQASLTYDKGPLSVTTAFNWVGGYDLTDPTPSGYYTNTCALGGTYIGWFPNGNIPSQYCRVQSFLDTDLTVYYRVNKQLNVHLAITDLFNRQPPLDFETYGGVGLPYSPGIAEAGVMGRFVNLGATYSF